MATEHFRAGVGIIVTRADGTVLAIERPRQPGQWQLPQGGIDKGEDAETAALRELEEETGLQRRDVREVTRHDDWLVYELPRELRSSRMGLGQTQKWFLFELVSERAVEKLKPNSEAKSFRWTNLDTLAEEVIAFRRPLYRKLAAIFRERLTRR
ncbi:RNA pyrophosphohydrolase [Myxococcota bacterium]|nr:RNA pyrophosphohydrolase [Myxococcota bacterium]